MLDRSINAPLSQANADTIQVWFTGATAVKKGQGFCYDHDRTGDGADEPDATRYNYVELPSITNARHFAGVAVRAYAASAAGQMIELAVPGSICQVLLLGPSVTNSSQLVTCQAGGTYAGYFTRAGFYGEGSALPLQTVDASSDAGLCLCRLVPGEPSGLVEVVTPTAGGAALTLMVGGVTYFAAAALTVNNTATLANGAIEGIKKKFEIEGDQGDTADIVITVTSGLQRDGSTALGTMTGDDDGDVAVLQWDGGQWNELYTTGWSDS